MEFLRYLIWGLVNLDSLRLINDVLQFLFSPLSGVHLCSR